MNDRRRYGIPVAPPDGEVAVVLKAKEEEFYKGVMVDKRVLAAEEKEG